MWVKSGQSSGFPVRAWKGCNFLSSCEPADAMGKVLRALGRCLSSLERNQADFHSLQPRHMLQTVEGIFPAFLVVLTQSWRNTLDVRVF